MEEKESRISFLLREIHNQIKSVIGKSLPKSGKVPQSQLQGGILGFLYHHRDQPVYQGEIERVFRISRATATNTLQVMEKNGLIVRRKQDQDGRLKRIYMMEEAEANHARLEAGMKKLEECMLEGLTAEEVSELERYLKLIRSNLDACTRSAMGGSGPAEHME